MTISENFNRFQYFNFEADFLENEKSFLKNWSIVFENASFPYKTAIFEANVKRNKMVPTKWTYHKEWSFASNYLKKKSV